MLRTGIVCAVLSLCLLPAIASAQAAHGPFEVTVSGAANNGPNFNGVTGALDGSIGYFFADALEVSLRQSVAYNDIGGVGWDASTRAALDFHVPILDWVLPYAGANIGYVYGDNGIRDTFEAAPEAGLKLFVNGTTFIYVSAEYQFFFNQNSNVNNVFKNGQFIYGLGIGFRF
jgi:opacity protein-like surface antigen